MMIQIKRGGEASALLTNNEFLADWLGLYERCPWATAFQHPDYSAVWNDVYRKRIEPVLVFSRDENGALNGLMALACSSEGGELFVAGGRQAEYQAWLCLPDRSSTFIANAVQQLKRDFPRAVLTFQYLHPRVPIDWLADSAMVRLSRLVCQRRLLVRFNRPEGNESSLNKKRTRYRLKQLEKLGRLDFQRVRDPREFQAIFDTIIQHYDFRQETVHGVAPFQNDDLKKKLVLARMENGIIRPHVTVLKVGEQIASAHIGFCSHKELHLGLLAHNPVFAKHSPGKFHILFLIQLLKEEGYEQLDLTPGDDPYKDNFANYCDEVHTLTLFLDRRQRTKTVIRERVAEVIKKGIRTCGLEPAKVKSAVSMLRSFGARFARK